MVRYFVLLGVLVAFGIRSATAQPQFWVQMRPGSTSASEKQTHFVYAAEAGAHIEDSVQLRNAGALPVQLRLYRAGAITAENGGVTILDANAPSTVVAQWVALETMEVTLGPQESFTVPFDIDVPLGVSAGEYVAGISAEIVTSDQNPRQAVHIQTIPRVVLPILLRVGRAHSADLTINNLAIEHKNGRYFLVADLENTGNVGIKPTARVAFYDVERALTHHQTVRLGYLMAGEGAIPLRIGLAANPLPESYQLMLTLAFEGQTAHAAIHHTVTGIALQQQAVASKNESVWVFGLLSVLTMWVVQRPCWCCQLKCSLYTLLPVTDVVTISANDRFQENTNA